MSQKLIFKMLSGKVVYSERAVRLNVKAEELAEVRSLMKG